MNGAGDDGGYDWLADADGAVAAPVEAEPHHDAPEPPHHSSSLNGTAPKHHVPLDTVTSTAAADPNARSPAELIAIIETLLEHDAHGVLSAAGPSVLSLSPAPPVTVEVPVARLAGALDGCGGSSSGHAGGFASSEHPGELLVLLRVPPPDRLSFVVGMQRLRAIFDARRAAVDTMSHAYRELTRLERVLDELSIPRNVATSPFVARAYGMLDTLWTRYDPHVLFKFPVSEAYAPRYTAVVKAKQRVALSDMYRRLRNGHYASAADAAAGKDPGNGALLRDLQGIVDASAAYNGSDSPVTQTAKDLKARAQHALSTSADVCDASIFRTPFFPPEELVVPVAGAVAATTAAPASSSAPPRKATRSEAAAKAAEAAAAEAAAAAAKAPRTRRAAAAAVAAPASEPEPAATARGGRVTRSAAAKEEAKVTTPSPERPAAQEGRRPTRAAAAAAREVIHDALSQPQRPAAAEKATRSTRSSAASKKAAVEAPVEEEQPPKTKRVSKASSKAAAAPAAASAPAASEELRLMADIARMQGELAKSLAAFQDLQQRRQAGGDVAVAAAPKSSRRGTARAAAEAAPAAAAKTTRTTTRRTAAAKAAAAAAPAEPSSSASSSTSSSDDDGSASDATELEVVASRTRSGRAAKQPRKAASRKAPKRGRRGQADDASDAEGADSDDELLVTSAARRTRAGAAAAKRERPRRAAALGVRAVTDMEADEDEGFAAMVSTAARRTPAEEAAAAQRAAKTSLKNEEAAAELDRTEALLELLERDAQERFGRATASGEERRYVGDRDTSARYEEARDLQRRLQGVIKAARLGL